MSDARDWFYECINIWFNHKSEKEESIREAVAKGSIYMKRDTLIVVIVGGTMEAKSTSDIIPMCHNNNIYGADLDFNIDESNNK